MNAYIKEYLFIILLENVFLCTNIQDQAKQHLLHYLNRLILIVINKTLYKVWSINVYI